MLGPVIGNKLIVLDETDSTNSHASRLLYEGYLDEGTAIQALYQRAGRGQRGNGWESVKGENLLISYVLYPEFLNASTQFALNQAVSLAVRDTLEKLSRETTWIKWPNDMIIQGGKVSGILIENTLRIGKVIQSITGIGINVNQSVFNTYFPPAISLRQLIGKEVDLDTCITELSFQLDKWYAALRLGQLQKIRNAYSSYLFRRDKVSTFEQEGNTFEAVIKGVTEEGKLDLELHGKERQHFGLKELKLLSY